MYKTYDINNVLIVNNDLQDKKTWCKDGLSYEYIFIDRFPQLGLRMNPDKTPKFWLPDLLTSNNNLADLKTQMTPFFESESKKGQFDPQYAVTFNTKDYNSYRNKYPEIDIYFWVNWTAIRYENLKNDGRLVKKSVNPMEGVWYISFKDLYYMICHEQPELIPYSQRKDDQKGNAEDSYLITLTHPLFKKVA